MHAYALIWYLHETLQTTTEGFILQVPDKYK